MKKKIKIETIDEVEIGGFDYPIEEELFPDWKDESDVLEEAGTYTYSYPISIEKLNSSIEKMSKDGANYVSIDYHEDHGSILIEGLNIESIELNVLTSEEIDDIVKQITTYENKINDNETVTHAMKTKVSELKEKLNNGVYDK